MRTPQHDIPAERIIHYIVKDYQRMYNGFHTMREEKQTYIDELLKKISKKTNTISNLQAENKKLREQIKDLKSSREAVVKAVTEDLEEQLENANRKMSLLAQAVAYPTKAVDIHTIVTDDDKKWMSKAMKQLEKAMISLTTIQTRLEETHDGMGKALEQRLIGGDADKVYRRFSKAFSKIDSCVSHIEDFFTKVGNIKIE